MKADNRDEVAPSADEALARMRGMTRFNGELMESLGGLHVVSADPASSAVRLEAEALPRFCHTNQTVVQGGFITAWLDAAMAHAAMLDTAMTQTVASLDINVRFLERLGPGPVVAEGRVVRRGRRVAFMSATLTDAAGRLVATASSSGMLVPLPAPA
ncbi:MAG: PaaI family thioesterase [Burkholderiaceae bacterium]|nr:PaaI family thioesterase [Burkholderiaceae bacterium]